MLTIKCASDKPCFICNGREKTVQVAFGDRSFRGILCLNHVHEKLKAEAPRAAGAANPKPG